MNAAKQATKGRTAEASNDMLALSEAAEVKMASAMALLEEAALMLRSAVRAGDECRDGWYEGEFDLGLLHAQVNARVAGLVEVIDALDELEA